MIAYVDFFLCSGVYATATSRVLVRFASAKMVWLAEPNNLSEPPPPHLIANISLEAFVPVQHRVHRGRRGRFFL